MISSRIRELRKKLNLTMAEFGKPLGVSKDVISNLEYGRVKPKDIFLEHICHIYHVSNAWLLSGDGEMFDTKTIENKTADEAMEVFNSLSPKLQVYALKQIKGLLEIQNTEDDGD